MTFILYFQELRLVVPNSQRLNRGNYEFKELLAACRANGVTDFIVVHEHRGTPDGLIICHLVLIKTVSFYTLQLRFLSEVMKDGVIVKPE
jgi:U3 small nucleolar ribonucleoprotein protein IMP4